VSAECRTIVADAPTGCAVVAASDALPAEPAIAEAIRRRLRSGTGVVLTGGAAASAGGVVLPAPTQGDSVAAVLRSLAPAGPGLALLPDVLIEPSLVSRDLLGRTAVAVARGDAPVAVGFDEGAAVRIAAGEPWEVAGDRPVVLIERGPDPAMPLIGLRFSMLWPGDRFDPAAGRILPASSLRSTVKVRRGERGLSRIDIFEGNAILQLADRLAQTPTDRAIGRAEQGRIRVTLRRTDETEIFIAGPRRTIVRMAMDVERAGASTPATRPGVAAPTRGAVSSTSDDARTPRLPPPPSPRPRGAAGR